MKIIKSCLQIVRPHHYIKNFFIWLPLFFGHKAGGHHAIIQTFYGFIVFCLASSGVYVFNDLKDIAADRQHPSKKYRPLASGALKPGMAWILLLAFLSLSVFLAIGCLSMEFLQILLAYLLLNIAYSIFLKHIPIIDICCVAVGFVLRVFAGGAAADVKLTHWIVVMTFLLALFLALAKRRDDLIIADNGLIIRKSLGGYNLEFVSSAMMVMASVIIVSYLLYTVSAEVRELHGTNQLYVTSLWVILGLLRYMQITFVEQKSGSPTIVIIKDGFMQIVIFLWFLNVYWLLYASDAIFQWIPVLVP
jgi:decaprenyl-phosphate phosphoribosyltransferase